MIKWMLITVGGLLCVVAAVIFWMGGAVEYVPGVQDETALKDPARIERGAYLAKVGNCMGCHSQPGKAPYAGGTALVTELGTFYGPNITADPDQGIGRWTADEFWMALHNGRGRDGRWLYPAFPYTSYKAVSREEADALFAYLRTVPADPTPSVSHDLSFPFNQRWLLRAWRALYFSPTGAVTQTEDPQRLGQRLVDGLAHCAECHTPRNRLGALDERRYLQGAPMPQGWYAPPLTGDPVTGLGNWSEEDVVALLKTGVNRHTQVTGPMAEAVVGGLQHVRSEDLQAMAGYLKSLPAAGLDQAAQAPAVPVTTMRRGADIYEQHCLACHGENGQGASAAWPPLAGNLSVTASDPHNAIRVVLEGGFAPVTAGNPQPHGMPPFGPFLKDQDIAAVVSYIRQSWGNRASGVNLSAIKRVREQSR